MVIERNERDSKKKTLSTDGDIKALDLENVEYAGFWLRVAAYIIDLVILAIPWFFLGMFDGFQAAQQGYDSPTFSAGALQGLSILVTLMYYGFLEGSDKQATFGKQAVGIKVYTVEGKKLTSLHAAGRHLAKFFSGMTFGIGFLMAGWTVKKQTLHDMAAGCIVVKES